MESRNCVLHLWTMLDWQRNQKNVQQTSTGCTLYPEPRDKERTYSWCSTWQDRSTKRIPHGLEYVEEMLQESRLSRWTFYRYSRSISQRSSWSWITTRNRMDRTQVQRDGRTCKRRPYISSNSRGRRKDTKDNGILLWTKQGKMGLWNFDLIFKPAVLMKNRLHHESGVQVEERLQQDQQRRWHSSSSTSWWDKSGIGSELIKFLVVQISLSFC